MGEAPRGSAARLRREAAKARLLALNSDDQAQRDELTAMAGMLEREAQAIEDALDNPE